MSTTRREFIEALVEEHVAAYVGLLPPEEMKQLRAFAYEVFTVHPELSKLVSEHAPREEVDRSGEVGGEGEAALDLQALRKNIGHG